MKRKSQRSRLFCFTSYSNERPVCDEFQYQGGVREICPTTGRHHWQCFGYLGEAKTFNSVCKMLPGCHVEIAKGSLVDNERYCSIGKGTGDTTGIVGTEYRIGVRPSQGHRTDLDEAGQLAMSGRMRDVNPSTYVRYHRGLLALYLLHQSPYKGERMVYWFFGPTMTGKTRTAHDMFPNAYVMSSDAGWFDGYQGESDVIIDDYDSGVFSIREFLLLTDRYPHRVKVKGAMVPWQAKNIVFTSHYWPPHYFPTDRWDEVSRRIGVMRKFVAESSITSATSV